MYCTTLLHSVNESLKNDLQIAQNKCMRTILKCDHYTPIRVMLNVLHILSVKDIIYIQTMAFIYKIVNNMFPSYLCDLIKFVKDVHSYDTRRKSNMYIDHRKTTKGQKSLLINGIKEYNNIPKYVRDLPSFQGLKLQ